MTGRWSCQQSLRSWEYTSRENQNWTHVPSFASPKPHLTTGEEGCKRHELTSLELGTLEVGAGRLQSSRPSWLHSETLSQFTRAEERGDRKGSCASRLEDDRGGWSLGRSQEAGNSPESSRPRYYWPQVPLEADEGGMYVGNA